MCSHCRFQIRSLCRTVWARTDGASSLSSSAHSYSVCNFKQTPATHHPASTWLDVQLASSETPESVGGVSKQQHVMFVDTCQTKGHAMVICIPCLLTWQEEKTLILKMHCVINLTLNSPSHAFVLRRTTCFHPSVGYRDGNSNRCGIEHQKYPQFPSLRHSWRSSAQGWRDTEFQ